MHRRSVGKGRVCDGLKGGINRKIGGLSKIGGFGEGVTDIGVDVGGDLETRGVEKRGRLEGEGRGVDGVGHVGDLQGEVHLVGGVEGEGVKIGGDDGRHAV